MKSSEPEQAAWICVGCVKPDRLKRLILEGGQEATCHYCGRTDRATPRKVLFDFIQERVEENVAHEEDLSHYELGMLYEVGDDSIQVADIDVALIEWFELDGEPYIDDLIAQLPAEFKKNERGHETHFYRDDGELERNIYETRWEAFVDGIRHSHRYFNPKAKDFLDSVFSFLVQGDSLKAACKRTLKSGEELYRARTVRSYEDAKEMSEQPADKFGPAPRDKASSQRMTPSGIPAMYCALERETCLSEIRSITGDSVVSVALTPVTGLELLDLTALASAEAPPLTLLDEGYLDALHLKTFVGSLVHKMSIPKARDEDLSYLSTQVVFEYLRLRFGSQVDGLVFPSVQTGKKGTNVVLFPEAGTVSSKVRRWRPIGHNARAKTSESDAKLEYVEGSMRFHKIVAIETHSVDYKHYSELFMNELTRKRLGL